MKNVKKDKKNLVENIDNHMLNKYLNDINYITKHIERNLKKINKNKLNMYKHTENNVNNITKNITTHIKKKNCNIYTNIIKIIGMN